MGPRLTWRRHGAGPSFAVMENIMQARLGIAPIAWWNDDLPELSDDVSLDECLRQARKPASPAWKPAGAFRWTRPN